MKAFFTGHRQISMSAIALLNQAVDIAISRGVTKFGNGMALGTDQEAAEILNRRNLDWTAIIPYAEQGTYWKWTQQQQQRYAEILKGASKQIVISPIYHNGCMQTRNQYMVHHSDICIAVYDGRFTGGTAGTVRMARDRNLPIIQINPKTLEISEIKPANQLSLF